MALGFLHERLPNLIEKRGVKVRLELRLIKLTAEDLGLTHEQLGEHDLSHCVLPSPSSLFHPLNLSSPYLSPPQPSLPLPTSLSSLLLSSLLPSSLRILSSPPRCSRVLREHVHHLCYVP